MDKMWRYIIAIAVLIILFMVIFKDDIGLSPKNSYSLTDNHDKYSEFVVQFELQSDNIKRNNEPVLLPEFNKKGERKAYK